ncbi:hypothetical protein [Agromyces sp. NPDC055658]
MTNVTPIGWDLALGRHKLYGVGLGLALDIAPDFTVTFYAITAEEETTDSGGSWGMWMGGDGRGTARPGIVLATGQDDPTPMTNARGEQVAEWCEMASAIGSRMLPRVLAAWGDPEATARLDAEVAGLEASAEFRQATAQVVAILRDAVGASLVGSEACS